jgi:ankyrin repeat protein
LEDQENGDFQFNYSADEESEARLKVFEHLIELGSDVNYQAPNGLNVLKIALSIGDTLIVDYLLEHMKTSMVEKYVDFKTKLKNLPFADLRALVFYHAWLPLARLMWKW